MFHTAIRIHRRIVDAAREYQLLQDGIALGGYGTGMSPGQTSSPADGFLAMPSSGMSPEQGWQFFIETESRKRYVYPRA